MDCAKLNMLLQQASAVGASDLHLYTGNLPFLRCDGRMQSIGKEVCEKNDMRTMIANMLTRSQQDRLEQIGDVDISYQCLEKGTEIYCRVNVYRDMNGYALAMRLLGKHIPSMQTLRIPASVRGLIKQKHGLVIISGPTGSGKTTTLAAMIEAMNCTESVHIISIEDPIEYRFTMKKAVISQREIGRDCSSFQAGLKASLRQHPDVILVGEIRDAETIATALNAAETGHLVFTTLHTSNVIEAVDRLVQYFPAEQHSQIRNELATSFQGIIAQKLLLSKTNIQVAAFEVLLPTDSTKNIIRKGEGYRMYDYMSPADGMQTMPMALDGLRNMRLID